MKTRKHIALFIALLMLLVLALAGCGGSTNTIETYALSQEEYAGKTALESATPPESFEAGKYIYASVYLIESPQGMEYTARWTADGSEIKTETKAMETDRQGMMVFTLEAEQVKAGIILCEILHGDDILLSQELLVQ